MGFEWIHDDAGLGKKLTIKVPARKSLDDDSFAQNPLQSPPRPRLTSPVEVNDRNWKLDDRVLKQPTANILDYYRFGKELGRGHFGVVRQCEDRQTAAVFACKTISKSNLKKKEEIKELQAEIGVMQHLAGHENVVHLQDVFEDHEAVHLVMELCKDGDLFDFIARKRRLPEQEAAKIFRQVVLAVQYCHSRGVVHRDLKPENILFAKVPHDGKGDLSVKLADFGLAVMVNPGEKATGLAGSPFYMAPELVRRKPYGPEIDVWSLGVILYTALSGFLPFWGKSHEQTFAAVCRGEADFVKKPWQMISPEAKSLVRKMLTMDPQRRATIDDILSHPWVLAHCPKTAPRNKVKPLVSGGLFGFQAETPSSPLHYGPNPHPIPQALSAPKGRFSPPRTPSPQSSPRAVPMKPSFSQFLPTPPGTPKANGEQSHITPFAAALAKPFKMLQHRDQRTQEQNTPGTPPATSPSTPGQTTPRPFFLSEPHEKLSSRQELILQRPLNGERGQSTIVEPADMADVVKADSDVSTEERNRISESSSSGDVHSGKESPRSHFEKVGSPASKGLVANFAAHFRNFVA